MFEGEVGRKFWHAAREVRITTSETKASRRFVDGATADGRRATVMVNLDPGGSDGQDADMKAAVQTALCAGRPAAAH
jgi:hypothetical protein